jgi:CarboxypepD_reg-like domain/TonB-dependent Receptor Plug Domain
MARASISVLYLCRMKLSAFFISLLFLFSFQMNAQTPIQTVRGKVVDNQTKSELVGVVVLLVDSGKVTKNTVTDASGNYRLPEVTVGRHTLTFRYFGYKEQTRAIIVSSGKEVIQNIDLEESVIQATEVVITDDQKSKPNNEMTTVSGRSFSIEETQRYAGSLGDPSRMAANYAGVSGSQDSRNDVVIRGNSPLGLLWRLNGADIPNPNHFGSFGSTGGPVSMLNNNVLDNSDFMTGAFPAEYGNALAGVFDLKMRNGNNEKFEFMSQFGFNGLEFGMEGPISKKRGSSFLINYRYSTLILFSKIGLEFGIGDAVPSYQDISYKLNFPTERFGNFAFWGVGGTSYVELLDSKRDTTRLDLYTIGGYDTYYGTRSGVTGFTHTYILKSDALSRLNIAVSGMQNYIKQDSVSFTDHTFWRNYGSDFRQYKITANYTFLKKFSARNTLKSGIYADQIRVNLRDSSNYNVTQFRHLRDIQDETWLLQAYSQWQHHFSDQFTLNVGLHSQVLLLNNSYSIEPRAGVRWHISEKQSLSFGTGLHSQMQTIFTYFNQTLMPDETYLTTNSEIDFSRAAHAIIAYDWNITSNMRIKVETYYQYLYSIPGLQHSSIYSGLNEGADFNAPGIDSLINNGTGQNYGIEFTIEKFYSKGFYFLITTSLFRSEFKPSDGVQRQSAFSGNYVVNLLGGKEFKFNDRNTLSFDFKLNAAGGKRYIPINLDASVLAGFAVYDYSQAYNQRYNGYFRMDCKIGYIHNGKHITQQFALELLNFTNSKNVFTQDFNRSSNSIVTNYQTGFLPVPSYKISF